MKISLLCSSADHPVNPWLKAWQEKHAATHAIELVRRVADLDAGDLLFLISCSELVPAEVRRRFKHTLVLHASDLPHGRGWSPHIWELLAGAEQLTLSLLEAENRVDSGRIWKKLRFPVPRTALWDEINARLFAAEIELLDYALQSPLPSAPQAQDESLGSNYYPRRRPEDSRLDPERSLAEQFNLLRVCDPARFPAFFDWHGQRYKLTLEKVSDDSADTQD